MKIKGKVLQVIKNSEINNYMFSNWIRPSLIESKKDIVTVENPLYPKSFFKKIVNHFTNEFMPMIPILMDATNIVEGLYIEVECDYFYMKTDWLIQSEAEIK